jgi:hypothetical protein
LRLLIAALLSAVVLGCNPPRGGSYSVWVTNKSDTAFFIRVGEWPLVEVYQLPADRTAKGPSWYLPDDGSVLLELLARDCQVLGQWPISAGQHEIFIELDGSFRLAEHQTGDSRGVIHVVQSCMPDPEELPYPEDLPSG